MSDESTFWNESEDWAAARGVPDLAKRAEWQRAVRFAVINQLITGGKRLSSVARSFRWPETHLLYWLGRYLAWDLHGLDDEGACSRRHDQLGPKAALEICRLSSAGLQPTQIGQQLAIPCVLVFAVLGRGGRLTTSFDHLSGLPNEMSANCYVELERLLRAGLAAKRSCKRQRARERRTPA